MIIGVIGGNSVDNQTYELEYQLGKAIAKEGWIIVCGGLRGVMEAVSKGAFENGGLTVGILPGNNKNTANPWIKIPIPTGIGVARNYIIVYTADIIVAINGRYGTLNEITAAFNAGKKVIGLNTWEMNKLNIDNNLFIPVSSVEEVIKKIKEIE